MTPAVIVAICVGGAGLVLSVYNTVVARLDRRAARRVVARVSAHPRMRGDEEGLWVLMGARVSVHNDGDRPLHVIRAFMTTRNGGIADVLDDVLSLPRDVPSGESITCDIDLAERDVFEPDGSYTLVVQVLVRQPGVSEPVEITSEEMKGRTLPI